MEFIKTKFDGAWKVQPAVHGDERGFFLESYSSKDFQTAGITASFVQDNHSLSVAPGVLRGLHLQRPPFAQSKIIRVIRGAIFDVIVDLRAHSPTFGQWEGFEMTETNFSMLFVPHGFAHGFCTLAPRTEVLYKVDTPYAPQYEGGIRWNDPDIGIQWPNDAPVLSEKDKNLPFFKDFISPF